MQIKTLYRFSHLTKLDHVINIEEIRWTVEPSLRLIEYSSLFLKLEGEILMMTFSVSERAGDDNGVFPHEMYYSDNIHLYFPLVLT